LPVQSIISFGSGESVIEYLIKNKCKSVINFDVSDFDKKLINHNRYLYGDIFSDYVVHDIKSGHLDLPSDKYQLALVNAVIYVLNQKEAKLLINNLALAKIEYILIVHTAQLFIFNEIIKSIKNIIKKTILIRDNKKTFWGWSRYKYEIISIAKSQGYQLVKYDSPDFGNYKRGIYLFRKEM